MKLLLLLIQYRLYLLGGQVCTRQKKMKKFWKKRNFLIPLCWITWYTKPFLKIWVILHYLVKYCIHTPGTTHTKEGLSHIKLSGITKHLKGNLQTYDKFPQTGAAAWPGAVATINPSYNLIAELSCLPGVPAGITHDYVVSCCLAMVSVVTCWAPCDYPLFTDKA